MADTTDIAPPPQRRPRGVSMGELMEKRTQRITDTVDITLLFLGK
ncbi:MAG TPA: hypothetical protein VKG65_10820 [Terriglobales bacterium]|nr:hypothetical protein [Terriglobales bacterium]